MTATVTPIDWGKRAACRSLSDFDAVFFGPDEETETEQAARETEAKQVCGHCQVRLRCLLLALNRNIAHGVFGGTGETERAALRETVTRHNRKLALLENAS